MRTLTRHDKANNRLHEYLNMSRPTIFEAAGGSPAFEALTVRFYEKVRVDPLLSPVFASFTAKHAKNVAIWLGEGLRRPAPLLRGAWRPSCGCLDRHRYRWRGLTPDQKERWVELMLETAREVFPNDNELQARFADYIRWGAQIALVASPARVRDQACRTSSQMGMDLGDRCLT